MSSANWGGNGLNSVQNLVYDVSDQSITLSPFGNTIFLDLSNSGTDLVGPNFSLDIGSFGEDISNNGNAIFQKYEAGLPNGDLARCNDALFRSWVVNYGSSFTGTVFDPNGNTYSVDKWILTIAGWTCTDDPVSISSLRLMPGTNGFWKLNVNATHNGGSTTIFVHILAIPGCFESCYDLGAPI
jgi:hypothetical protein